MSGNIQPGIYDKTVLIADPDEFFRMALIDVLTRNLGFTKVIEASSFPEALEHLEKGSDVGLAIFEINVPGMDNWLDIRSIRTSYPDVRVSVASTSQKSGDVLMALQAGLHGYIYKGLGVTEVERALRVVCDGSIYVPALLADRIMTDRPDQDDSIVVLRKNDRRIPSMTARQWEILNLLVAGKSNKDMARSLGLSEGTVKFHLAALFRLFGSSNRVEVATAGFKLLKQDEVIASVFQEKPLSLLVH